MASPDCKYKYVGWYLKNCKEAYRLLNNGDGFFFGGRFSGGPTVTTLGQWKRLFTDALDRRINSKAGLPECRGRKDNQDWQRWCFQFSGRINTPRLRVYERECRGIETKYVARLAHRLTADDDI